MVLILRLVVLGVLGIIVGMIVAAVATSYSADRGFWPWPRRQVCHVDAPLRASHACINALIPPRHTHHGHAPTPHLRWVGVVTAAIFCGLGVQDATEPALLLVSLVEATLLILLLVIDIEVRLVPTPVVGLLVAVALANAGLWPGVGLWNALRGGAVGFASFTALVGLARLFCGVGALGLGDAYLALAIGCITGYPLVIGTLVLGIIIGGAAAAVLLLLGRVGLHQTILCFLAKAQIPYGPALMTATICILFYGRTMHL